MADQPNLTEQDHRAIATLVCQALAPDFKAILEHSAKPPAPTEPAGRPPANFDGIDARSIGRLKNDLLEDTERLVRKTTSEFVPAEEIDEKIKSATDKVSSRFREFDSNFAAEVAKAVTAETNKLRNELYQFAEDINLPLGRSDGSPLDRVDKDKRQESLETIRGIVSSFKGGKAIREEIRKQFKVWFWGWVTLTFGAVGSWMATRLFGGSH